MALFGTYEHSLDAKGRVNFPAKLRESLGRTFYLTPSLDNKKCLLVYDTETWEALAEKIRQQLPAADLAVVQRYLFSQASEAEPDKQGRINIPGNLRERAGLEKDLAIIGSGNHAEIWDKGAWDQFQAQEATTERIAGLLGNLLL